MAELDDDMADIIADPAYSKGMRELVDLRHLTDWERDFPAIMRHQALEAEVHDDPHRPTLVVCLAPDEHTRSLAQVINRAWENSHRVVTVTVETEPEVIDI